MFTPQTKLPAPVEEDEWEEEGCVDEEEESDKAGDRRQRRESEDTFRQEESQGSPASQRTPPPAERRKHISLFKSLSLRRLNLVGDSGPKKIKGRKSRSSSDVRDARDDLLPHSPPCPPSPGTPPASPPVAPPPTSRRKKIWNSFRSRTRRLRGKNRDKESSGDSPPDVGSGTTDEEGGPAQIEVLTRPPYVRRWRSDMERTVSMDTSTSVPDDDPVDRQPPRRQVSLDTGSGAGEDAEGDVGLMGPADNNTHDILDTQEDEMDSGIALVESFHPSDSSPLTTSSTLDALDLQSSVQPAWSLIPRLSSSEITSYSVFSCTPEEEDRRQRSNLLVTSSSINVVTILTKSSIDHLSDSSGSLATSLLASSHNLVESSVSAMDMSTEMLVPVVDLTQEPDPVYGQARPLLGVESTSMSAFSPLFDSSFDEACPWREPADEDVGIVASESAFSPLFNSSTEELSTWRESSTELADLGTEGNALRQAHSSENADETSMNMFSPLFDQSIDEPSTSREPGTGLADRSAMGAALVETESVVLTALELLSALVEDDSAGALVTMEWSPIDGRPVYCQPRPLVDCTVSVIQASLGSRQRTHSLLSSPGEAMSLQPHWLVAYTEQSEEEVDTTRRMMTFRKTLQIVRVMHKLRSAGQGMGSMLIESLDRVPSVFRPALEGPADDAPGPSKVNLRQQVVLSRPTLVPAPRFSHDYRAALLKRRQTTHMVRMLRRVKRAKAGLGAKMRKGERKKSKAIRKKSKAFKEDVGDEDSSDVVAPIQHRDLRALSSSVVLHEDERGLRMLLTKAGHAKRRAKKMTMRSLASMGIDLTSCSRLTKRRFWLAAYRKFYRAAERSLSRMRHLKERRYWARRWRYVRGIRCVRVPEKGRLALKIVLPVMEKTSSNFSFDDSWGYESEDSDEDEDDSDDDSYIDTDESWKEDDVSMSTFSVVHGMSATNIDDDTLSVTESIFRSQLPGKKLSTHSLSSVASDQSFKDDYEVEVFGAEEGPEPSQVYSDFKIVQSRQVDQETLLRQRQNALMEHPFFVLDVRLQEGKDLVVRDSCGTSDPYVKFKIAGKQVYRSRTIYKNLNPKWEETFSIPIEDVNTPVYIKVFDYDRGFHDDPMGTTEIDLSQMELGKSSDLKLLLSDRGKPDYMGYLLMTCTLNAKTQEDKDQFMRRNVRPAESASKKLKMQSWSGVVSIVLVEGVDLVPMDDNGLSDPYVKFRLGNEKYRSKHQRKTLCPRWLEQFDLRMYNDQANLLEITAYDYDVTGKDDFMGRATIDLSTLEAELTHHLDVELEDGAGLLRLLLTITGTFSSDAQSDLCNYTPDSRQQEQLHKKYSLLKLTDISDVGTLQVKVFKANSLKSADLGGQSDPFCVLELVNARVQTHTEYKTLNPEWNKVFNFKVRDIHSVLELTVFDEDRDKKVEFLGKVAIPLLRVKNGERRWYVLKDKKLQRRTKGAILLEMDLIFNHAKAAIRTVNPAEEKFMQVEPKFKIHLMKRNIDRVSQLISTFVEGGKFLQSCFNWESTPRSITAFIVFLVMVWNFELYMLPITLLLIFLKNLLIAQIVGAFKRDQAEDEYFDEDDEDEDEEKEKEEKKSFKEKLQSIQDVCLQVQQGMDMVASLGERIKNTFNWTVPWLSTLAVVALTAGVIIFYFIPLRLLILAWGLKKFIKKGINKFTKKLRKPNYISNNELLDFLSRVPSDSELVQYRELRPELSPAPGKKKRS